MLILGIDTSGKTASVALYKDGIILAQQTLYTSRTHSQVILPMVKRTLQDTGIEFSDVDIISAAKGPGSYTGLRIGIAAVKAMAFAADKKCAGISTLLSLAYNVCGFGATICSIMNARQDLVYAALFEDKDGKPERLCDDCITECDVLSEKLKAYKNVILVGDGAEEFYDKYQPQNSVLAPPHLRLQLASSLCLAALDEETITPDCLEPDYLQPTKAEKDLCKKV